MMALVKCVDPVADLSGLIAAGRSVVVVDDEHLVRVGIDGQEQIMTYTRTDGIDTVLIIDVGKEVRLFGSLVAIDETRRVEIDMQVGTYGIDDLHR